MEQVGIQELRQNLSIVLAKVKAGAAFEVTQRGKPIAVLGPLETKEEIRQRLVDEGAVTPAKGKWSDHLLPVEEVDSNQTASKYLQEMREDRI